MSRPVLSWTPIAMSGDCSSIAVIIPHVDQSRPSLALSRPISLSVFLTTLDMSTYALVVICPVSRTMPCMTMVSQATCAAGSFSSIASSTESDIWSATLSGCPSATLSDVKE